MGQETCEKCGRGRPGHSAEVCNEYIAQRQLEERVRADQEQREQRLVTSAARGASRKTALLIVAGASLVLILLVAVLIGATGNAKQGGPSGVTASPSASQRPQIVIRPRHPSP